ncbi:PHP domain-containing protein [Egicoccus sp. AB-alg6-2]|uniref:PHP domain-containing protein n=1 Tax=Egicoccus sp. AB-alg6-2 TaxID=3242692 RepID=UPI00359D512F
MAGFDLHTHTIFSDGTTTPADNVRDAVALGLEGLGVTDHDTTAPFEAARAACEGTGLELVLGTEFSAELDGYSVHVLGYWIDPSYPPLVEELDRLRNEREHRARAIVDKFVGLGVEVTFSRVQELAGAAPIGRPHIAQAVVEAGAAPDTRTVFDTWLADGGPAYVEKHAVAPRRAVELLVAAGGVAVLAHPGLYGTAGEPGRGGDGDGRALGPGLPAEAIEEMVAAGLAGIEADHPDHPDEHRRRYRDLAAAHGLEVTAGSDYHGAGKVNPLGSATTPREVVERLRGWRHA